MMIPRSSRSRRLAAGLSLASLLALGWGQSATAQGLTPDPYKPYNSRYTPYVYPVYPSNDSFFPNQGRLAGPSGPASANQFQDYLDQLDAGGSPGDGPLGVGSPYYRAYRRFGRESGPNNSPRDREFRERQRERETKYFEARKIYESAIAERDPQKRARLIREYAAAKREVERDFARPRASAGAAGTSTSTPPRPTSPPGSPAAPDSPGTPATARPGAAATTPPGRAPLRAPRPVRTPAQILEESRRLDRLTRPGALPRPSLPSDSEPK